MSRRNNDSADWLMIIVVILILAPFLGGMYACDRASKWLWSDWTPQRKRFWISTLIGLAVLVAIGILIAVKSATH